MLKATERVDVPLSELAATGRRDLDRNLAALKEACATFAPGVSLSECVAKARTALFRTTCVSGWTALFRTTCVSGWTALFRTTCVSGWLLSASANQNPASHRLADSEHNQPLTEYCAHSTDSVYCPCPPTGFVLNANKRFVAFFLWHRL